MTQPLLEVVGLQKYYPATTGSLLRRKAGWVKAAEAMDFSVAAGETLGLIGESGCGKTTTAKLIHYASGEDLMVFIECRPRK